MAAQGDKGADGRRKAVGAGRRKRKSEAPVAEGLTPLDYLVQVLRDESQTRAVRMNAAKSAVPYLHARMATRELKGKDVNEVGEALADLIRRAQEGGGGVAGLVKRG